MNFEDLVLFYFKKLRYRILLLKSLGFRGSIRQISLWTLLLLLVFLLQFVSSLLAWGYTLLVFIPFCIYWGKKNRNIRQLDGQKIMLSNGRMQYRLNAVETYLKDNNAYNQRKIASFIRILEERKRQKLTISKFHVWLSSIVSIGITLFCMLLSRWIEAGNMSADSISILITLALSIILHTSTIAFFLWSLYSVIHRLFLDDSSMNLEMHEILISIESNLVDQGS